MSWISFLFHGLCSSYVAFCIFATLCLAFLEVGVEVGNRAHWRGQLTAFANNCSFNPPVSALDSPRILNSNIREEKELASPQWWSAEHGHSKDEALFSPTSSVV